VLVTHDQTEAMAMADRVAVMNEGVLQQLAAPRALYDHPANLFVAQFIGEPPMNVLRGRLVDIAGVPVVEGDGWRAALPSRLAAAARDVVIGVRPEDVVVRAGGDGATRGDVDVVSVSRESGAQGQIITAETPAGVGWAEDDQVTLSFRGPLHVFDAASGRNLG